MAMIRITHFLIRFLAHTQAHAHAETHTHTLSHFPQPHLSNVRFLLVFWVGPALSSGQMRSLNRNKKKRVVVPLTEFVCILSQRV